MNQHSLTKEDLFGSLEKDGIKVEASTIAKAKNGNGHALFFIGYEYHNSLKDYTKAMEWYLLSAKTNYNLAQNNIGHLYSDGYGVPISYDIAIEWFLKAAKQKNKTAYKNIGLSFEKGEGVSIDKYKALEWYHKHSIASETITRLNSEGYFLTDLDKFKSLDLLVMETNEIVDTKKRKDMEEMEEQIRLLQDIVSSLNVELQEKSNTIVSLNTKIDGLVTRFSQEQHEDKKKIELLSDNSQLLKQSYEKRQDEIDLLQQTNKQLEEGIENTKAASTHRESVLVDACEERFDQLDQKISDLNNNFMQLLINTSILPKRSLTRRFSATASKRKSSLEASSLF